MDMSSYSSGYSIGYNFGYDLGYNAGFSDGKKSTDESTAEDSLETVELTEAPAPVVEEADSYLSDIIESNLFVFLMALATIICFISGFSFISRISRRM